MAPEITTVAWRRSLTDRLPGTERQTGAFGRCHKLPICGYGNCVGGTRAGVHACSERTTIHSTTRTLAFMFGLSRDHTSWTGNDFSRIPSRVGSNSAIGSFLKPDRDNPQTRVRWITQSFTVGAPHGLPARLHRLGPPRRDIRLIGSLRDHPPYSRPRCTPLRHRCLLLPLLTSGDAHTVTFMRVGYAPHRSVQVVGFDDCGHITPVHRLIRFPFTADQRFASGFLQTPVARAALAAQLVRPFAGCAVDFRLRVGALCQAHQKENPWFLAEPRAVFFCCRYWDLRSALRLGHRRTAPVPDSRTAGSYSRKPSLKSEGSCRRGSGCRR